MGLWMIANLTCTEAPFLTWLLRRVLQHNHPLNRREKKRKDFRVWPARLKGWALGERAWGGALGMTRAGQRGALLLLLLLLLAAGAAGLLRLRLRMQGGA